MSQQEINEWLSHDERGSVFDWSWVMDTCVKESIMLDNKDSVSVCLHRKAIKATVNRAQTFTVLAWYER